MNTKTRIEDWDLARFPSIGLRQEFLQQLEVWNKVEGLPTIDFEPQRDGRALRFRSQDDRVEGIRRLIDSYGGYIRPSCLDN